MLAQIKSASLTGLHVNQIKVEIDASRGLPSWDIVGLPDAAVKESKERVRTAIKNAGFDFPARRIVVNLAPANLRKEGPRFDLAIAIAILVATEQLDESDTQDALFLGELGLDGSLRPISGVLPVALAKEYQNDLLIVPEQNAKEAAIGSKNVFGCANLQEVVALLKNKGERLHEAQPNLTTWLEAEDLYEVDFADIKGQFEAKRALEIAAAGNHNLIMIGAPGSGKTMLAKALAGIMPPLTLEESLEVTKIYSISDRLTKDEPLIKKRPFRSPHHTASTASLIGGGRIPQPGEVSLAHHGVLFMDEFPEYRRDVLEALRQPLEDRTVTVSRTSAQLSFPCDFLLIASMNPCPCGHLNDPVKDCTCSMAQINRYHHKVSGPLLDRFDIQLEVLPVTFDDLYDKTEQAESSKDIKERVKKARYIQFERLKKYNIYANGMMSARHIAQYCQLTDDGKALLEKAFHQLGLSARGHHRILKVARTIADLAESEMIMPIHLAEAIQYRALDKNIWQH